jgi:phosphotransferase system enzyme I (PtsI)
MILDDPDMLSAVERGVARAASQCRVRCSRACMGSVAARFENLDDEYLRERRSDILDCERRVLRHLLSAGRRSLPTFKQPAIIVAHDLGPSEWAMLPREQVLAFVLEVGGRTSHGCDRRARPRYPAVLSVRGALQALHPGDRAAVDGFSGTVEVNPDEAQGRALSPAARATAAADGFACRRCWTSPATTLDGRRIELGANLELPTDAPQALEAGADGVGLFRTEFFYLNRVDLPGEEEQYAAYREVTRDDSSRAGDLPHHGPGRGQGRVVLGMTHETNPFLGLRGIRLALASPDMFRTQLRAIYRAARTDGAAHVPHGVEREELLRALELRDEVVATSARTASRTIRTSRRAS